jgi:DNA-binding NtrC family response regulator
MSPVAEAEAPRSTVLVVDDERNIRRTLELILSDEGLHVLQAESGESALDALAAPNTPVDIVILDIKLPGISGLEVLARLRRDDATRGLPVIVISGHGSVSDAVAATKLGADDFVEKPLSRERVLVSVRNALESARIKHRLEVVERAEVSRHEMIGKSLPMQRLFLDMEKVAPTRASVLITGESGTGKELISRAVHRMSTRKDGPFVKVNCAAIPRELIESELFGHERGAFTGAIARKRGVFEQAHGGTLFLDEIGDMDLFAQAKLLRALQSGEISRVGSEHTMVVDVRVLAATNKDLTRAVENATFREDLFFRLNVFPLRTPSLRERAEDIPMLVRAFCVAFSRDHGMVDKSIDDTVISALMARPWPGNVRELKNVVERMVILAGERVTIAELPEDPHANPFDDDEADPVQLPSAAIGAPLTLRAVREQAERSYILETLRNTQWNISRAAVVLGVERTNLHKKIRAYRIRRETPG